MKKLLQLLFLLLLTANFSCTDRKSTEQRFNRAETEVEKDSLATKVDSAVLSADKDAVKMKNEKDGVNEITGDREISFAKIPEELSDQIDQNEVPTSEAIGIKAYPEAYIVKLNPTEYRGKRYTTLELVSPDSPEEVLKYYKRWDSNWAFMEGTGVYTFKKDKEKYFRETNTLQILSFNKDLHQDLAKIFNFQPRSLIRIYYEVK